LRGADLAESITNCFTEPIYVTHRWRGACLIGAELAVLTSVTRKAQKQASWPAR
jgi:hypothetical protein